ncbi:DNA mismatch repair endonuclease MutL [Moritella viscosa]|uniref:DNA mismatch repair endonuclease MutL n=1 Tax=Moritella viscosa TaxID=80854 RepID=UPI000916C823|nr:DNA mismatch repair endonuclease MutL [Moritella viscosa]SHN96232.1 DNA mismatch repair protein mutL [Moritella viscosa]SHN96592.1 DNA mismatch repair protein mutL [Moritella viscosa]
MTIQILPPRLANQIAAGEVVERPSSVVKELIENSIDAGATRIDIDIEKGGAKLIRLRDNGSGVEKDQLGLALSRHATSKLATLDDLESIDSLGFRGEALASISSVSRLTFTSRTKAQTEAWQAYAEGRDMQVQIKPAAHPIGTTVEVIDLFFNTPARRKFLRTDKTEFNHIDELVKRIALSRFDLQITLKHNGKVIRSYRPASSIEQQERRVASITSTNFMANCMALNCEHSDIKLWGWVGLPHDNAPMDVQYSYVNGRMMRDKLINHALRQAYEEATGIAAPPAYVLFIEASVREVDVNVHPAKHEVRFHQARLVHDFIFQGVFKAITEGVSPSISTTELPVQEAISYPGQASINSSSNTSVNEQNTGHGVAHGGIVDSAVTLAHDDVMPMQKQHGYGVTDTRQASTSATSSNYAQQRQYMPDKPSAGAIKQYNHLLQPSKAEITELQLAARNTATTSVNQGRQVGSNTQPNEQHITRVKLLSLVVDNYLLLQDDDVIFLADVLAMWQVNCKMQLLEAWEQGVISQPLLLPISIKLDKNFVETAKNQQNLLNRLGLELNYSNAATIIVRKVPAQLRQANLSAVLPELLQQIVHLSEKASASDVAPLCHWLAIQGSHGLTKFTWEQATQIYSQFIEQDSCVQQQYSSKLFEKLDYMSVIERFNCDSTAN